MADTTRVPADVAMTTTTAGEAVPFVVRVETGTMNRGIYQNLVLHDPTKDPAPTPFAPPPAWNRRLIAMHGVGCPSGWYRQGGVMGVNPLTGAQLTRLGEGYALFTNTLNHPTNSCNAFLAGETTMMGKEHFIEDLRRAGLHGQHGRVGRRLHQPAGRRRVPRPVRRHPDHRDVPRRAVDRARPARTRICSPLFRGQKRPARSRRAGGRGLRLSGHEGVSRRREPESAHRSGRRPRRLAGYKPAVWNEAVPAALRYDAAKNPHGARPTVFDAASNIYGVDPKTGFALRPVRQRRRAVRAQRAERRRHHAGAVPRSERADRRLRPGRQLRSRALDRRRRRDQARVPGRRHARRRRRPRLDPGVRRWRLQRRRRLSLPVVPLRDPRADGESRTATPTTT